MYQDRLHDAMVDKPARNQRCNCDFALAAVYVDTTSSAYLSVAAITCANKKRPRSDYLFVVTEVDNALRG